MITVIDIGTRPQVATVDGHVRNILSETETGTRATVAVRDVEPGKTFLVARTDRTQVVYVLEGKDVSLTYTSAGQTTEYQTQRRVGVYLEPGAWAQPEGVRFGNSRINQFRGPGGWNLDFSLFRTLPLAGKHRLEVRIDFVPDGGAVPPRRVGPEGRRRIHRAAQSLAILNAAEIMPLLDRPRSGSTATGTAPDPRQRKQRTPGTETPAGASDEEK